LGEKLLRVAARRPIKSEGGRARDGKKNEEMERKTKSKSTDGFF
jgi:hypothetical protein